MRRESHLVRTDLAASDAAGTSHHISQFDLFLNGAFLTGVALDSDKLITDGYGAAQQRLVEHLNVEGLRDWSSTQIQQGKPWYSTSGLYASLIPLDLITFRGERLRCTLTEIIQRSIALRVLTPTPKVCLLDSTIGYLDSGVGIFSAYIRVSLEAPVTLEVIRRLVQADTRLMRRKIDVTLAAITARFSDGCRDCISGYLLDVPWCQDDGRQRSISRRDSESPETAVERTLSAKLLWLHSTYVLSASEQNLDHVETECRKLLPVIYSHVQHQSFSFFPGIAVSVIVRRSDRSERHYIVKVGDVMALMNFQWAVFAVMMETDRTLFRRLNGFTSNGSSTSSRALELEAQSVLALYDQVRLFQGLIDSVLIDFGHPALDIWDSMAEVQGLDRVLSAARQKLDALYQACQTRLARATAKRQRDLGLTIDFFAIFGVLGGVTAAATYLFSSEISTPWWIRITVTVSAIVSVLAVIALRELVGRQRQ